MKINRFLPILSPLFIFLLLEIFYFFPHIFYIAIVLSFLFNFFSFWQFTTESAKEERWWHFAILPFLVFVGTMFFVSPLNIAFLPLKIFTQILFALNLIFLYHYYRAVYYYLIKPEFYKNKLLENFAFFGGFLSFFFISSFIYGLGSLVGVAMWVLMLLMLVLIALEIYQIFHANHIEKIKGLFFLLLISLVLFEFAWSLAFLSLSYYILGAILSFYFYIIVGLSLFYLKGTLNKKLIKTYLFLGVFSILIILLTSRWYG